MKLNTTIKQLLSWSLALVLALLLSSCFVLIYSYSGTHIASATGATDYTWKPNQYKANATEGFVWIRMDDNGYNNLSSATDDIDILLMGASHMEAVNVPRQKNTGALLNQVLPDMRTYNIGISAHRVPVCLDNLESAIRVYRPQKYIIIHTGSTSFSEQDLKDVLAHALPDIPSYDHGLVYQLQKVPSIKVLYKQIQDKLEIDMRAQKAASANGEAEEEKNADSEKAALLAKVLRQKNDLCREYGIQLILAFTPGVEISADSLRRTDDPDETTLLRETCESLGIVFVDTYDAFQTHYQDTYMPPYGFANTRLGSGHMNETGHAILANCLADTIRELEGAA